MTGADVIAVIILIALAIAIAVYLLHWLYRRSSKEVSFVRTGLGGEKIVISGGAFVLPIIHNVTTVGMRTLRIEVRRAGDKSLITKNRMRVEIAAEFYVRVKPTEEAVATAARSLSKLTLEPEGLRDLVQGRFVDALGTVAAQMSMDEMQERRGDYSKAVKALAEDTLSQTGLELEAVSLTGLDQADLQVFNPSNAFDAEGLTQLTEQIEMRKKKRNDIEQDTAIQIRNKNLEAEKIALDIDRESEFARLAQEREITKQRAKERSEMAIERANQEREAEEAQIKVDEEVEKARISQQQAIEVERSLREHKLTLAIEERRRLRNEVEKDTAINIEQKNLEAEIETLEISKESEYARLKQQEEIAVRRAQQKADVVKEEVERYRESEQAQIKAQEDVKKSQIAQQQSIERERIESEEKIQAREIEKRKQLELVEKEREIAVTEKSKLLLKANEEEELIRAQAVAAEEKVASARELEVAERKKKIELIRAAQQVEREAIQVTTLARAEKEASQEREQAEKFASLAAKLRYEVDASGKQMLNEAENMRSDASRRSALRMMLAKNLDSIIREAVKPMQNIDAIKILEVNGLPGFSGGQPQLGSGGGIGPADGDVPGGPRGANLADSVVNSALRYRAHMPFVDNLLQEIGMSPGEISNISNILGGFEKEVTDESGSKPGPTKKS
jgi:uncharacterized membrane protein YqiK